MEDEGKKNYLLKSLVTLWKWLIKIGVTKSEQWFDKKKIWNQFPVAISNQWGNEYWKPIAQSAKLQRRYPQNNNNNNNNRNKKQIQ